MRLLPKRISARAWTWLAFVSGAASAGTFGATTIDASQSPDWRTLALGAVSAVAAMIAAHARGLHGRVNRLENNLNELDRIVGRDYHTKVELERLLDRAIKPLTHQLVEVKNAIETVHERMDGMRGPYRRHQQPDDGA